jgi:hypothetical protein
MICVECVTPISLKKLVLESGNEAVCRYCSSGGTCIKSDALFDYVLERVNENVGTKDDLSHFELGMIYEGGSDEIPVQTIDIVLAEWLNLGDEKYFDDLMKYLPPNYEKDEDGSEKHFYGDDGTLEHNIFEEKWGRFVNEIRHSHRFFNPRAKEFLESLFSFLSTAEGNLRPECIRTIKRGEELYRARTAPTLSDASQMKEDPVRQFGLAPKERVGNQRMTPNGIPALYCAFERQTCLSEIRSITGDHVVSIALTPVKNLALLDLNKLEHIENPESTLLDVGHRDTMHLHGFVRSLVKRMSRPKGRNDELIYLSTQVVFEYLRLTFASQVHGLVFPSVQTGEKGTNLVLFPEYSTVSNDFFNRLDDIDKMFGARPEQIFEKPAYLACIAGSVRFHKVRAIVTEADEYDHIYRLYESDLDKRRLNL